VGGTRDAGTGVEPSRGVASNREDIQTRRGEDEGVSARDLVVRPGDRVSAFGRYVLCDDGEWLDLARVDGLVIHRAGRRSSRSVRLIGLDPAGVPRDFGSDEHIPGFVRVTGIWQDETIRVDDQGTVAYPAQSHREFAPPCAAPRGGWDPPNVHGPHT
jgi:hypothetical protein